MRRAIGILCSTPSAARTARDFLISSGLFAPELYIIKSHYDACMIRRGGGLVVHLTEADRPRFAGHAKPDGSTIEVGDLVVERATNPGEYLPRLLSVILTEVPNAGGVSDHG